MNAYAPIAMVQHATRAYGAGGLGAGSAVQRLGSLDGAGGSGAGFGGMVGQAMESVLSTMHRSERVTAQGMAGKADVQDVVQAASDAEITVKSTVAVLGKAINAYNDVVKMTV